MYDRKGSLFQRPFKQKPIDSETYLKEVIFYIHHNPVHHGFTERMEDWPYSSFPALLTDKLTMLKRKAVQELLGGKANARKFHDCAIKNLDKLEMEFT